MTESLSLIAFSEINRHTLYTLSNPIPPYQPVVNGSQRIPVSKLSSAVYCLLFKRGAIRYRLDATYRHSEDFANTSVKMALKELVGKRLFTRTVRWNGKRIRSEKVLEGSVMGPIDDREIQGPDIDS
ncbi:hypothetical protein E2C01_078820 [Portunus trituberculatus]|uniref:Uncharacterized protein n=1 Tax=Portunus trituberculatus TaxID=210409 RepID=A0A5B7IV55_PORTR|nr:hypothetical protein [Portunus trituberculatus]